MLEADHKHLKEKLKKNTQMLSDDKDVLDNARESKDYETVLSEVSTALDLAQASTMKEIILFR